MAIKVAQILLHLTAHKLCAPSISHNLILQNPRMVNRSTRKRITTGAPVNKDVIRITANCPISHCCWVIFSLIENIAQSTIFGLKQCKVNIFLRKYSSTTMTISCLEPNGSRPILSQYRPIHNIDLSTILSFSMELLTLGLVMKWLLLFNYFL